MLPPPMSPASRSGAALLCLLLVLPALGTAADHGSENVNSFQGAFSYAVPLQVPAFRGIEPRLALSYSSEAGNGFAGVGWNLAGLGVIQRVSEFGGVPNWDGGDAWLLGGVKLVSCQGGVLQSPSCDNGGSHTAEKENRLKIVYDDVADTWTTWAPNGVRSVYEPIISAPSGALRYGIASVEDTLGNQVSYDWTVAGYDAYPDTISYGNYEIVFHRKARPDPISFPLENAVRKELYRLSSVVVQRAGGALIRAYGLSYDVSPETGRSLLASVQQYGTDAVVASGVVTGGTSLPPQTFTYQEDPAGRTFVDQGLPYPEAATFANCTKGASGDFDGDGIVDKACVIGAGIDVAVGPAGPVTTWLTAGVDKIVGAADINRDGKADLVLFDQWPGDMHVSFSTGSSFSAPVFWGEATGTWNGAPFDCRMPNAIWYGIGNFNGDDRPDVYCKRSDLEPVVVGINTGSGFSFSAWGAYVFGASEATVGVADFDGDGLDDLYAIAGDTDKFVVRPNTGYGSFELSTGPTSPAGFCDAQQYVVGDFDGNGLTDIGCRTGKVALSSGLYFHEQPNAVGLSPGCANSVTAADVDADGAAELVCKSNVSPYDVTVHEWDGSAFAPAELWNSGWCSGTLGTLDADADAKLDAQCSNGKVASAGTPGLKPDLLVGVANGLGGTTQVAYTPSSAFPNVNGPPVKYAVTSITTDDGRSNVATTTFDYADGLMDWAKGEFRGFGYVKRTLPCLDGEGQCPYVETWLRQGELTAGRPSRVERHADDGTLISAQDFTYEVNAPGSGGGGGPPAAQTEYVYPRATVPNNNGNTVTGAAYAHLALDDPASSPDGDATKVWNIDRGFGQAVWSGYPQADPASIEKITVRWRMRSNGYSPNHYTAAHVFMPNGQYYASSQKILSSAWQTFAHTWTTNPQTGAAWTIPDLNSLRIGAGAYGPSGVGVSLTQLYLEMRYIPQPPPPPPTETQTLTRIALLSEVTDYSFDGSGNACASWPCAYGKRRKTTFSYDGYGNRVQTVTHGDLDVPGDEVTSITAYKPNASAFIVGAPAQVEAYEGVGTGGTLLSSRRFVYDGQTGWSSPPTAGRVTKTESWLDVETRYVASEVAYDAFGNVTSQTDPTGRTSTIAYDATDNQFPVTITNPAGEAVTTVWDPLCGVPTQATDANGQVATQQYDALCRLTRRDGPLGTFEEYFYDALGNPNAQHTRVETPSPTGSGVHHGESWFDGFGRTYHTASTGPSGTDIVRDTVYNRRGNVASTTKPYFAGGTPQTTTYEYDPFDRLVRTNLPDGTPLTTECGLWQVTRNDAHGHPSTMRYDAYGRKIESERDDGGQPVVTSYAYDALGRMVGMSDAAGNEWEWMFDSLGRNYLIDDPDAGIRTFVFDDAGRTLESLDALSQKTEFGYDPTSGRLTSKTIRHPGGSVYRTIGYTYGQARSGYFNVGQLTTVTSPVDVQRIDYDALGRAVHLERDFEGQTYEIEKRYDAAGRVLGITFPDGDAIGTPGSPFTYDAAGRLVSIPGILTSVAYDAAGRALTQTNANGTLTTRAFDPQRGFLNNITTTGPGGTLQNLGYGYDLAGMVTGVTSSFDNEMWSYGYDDLHRLTSATNVTHPANTRSYGYDVVGNMTYNSQVGTITYPTPGSFRPHAPQQVGLDVYQYDANGQLIQQGAETLSWNPDGSLQGKNATFVYGSGGAPDRLKVDTGTSTSIFPFGDDHEITDGVVTKYVSAPGLGVIAKKVDTTTYWIHTDRQGSVNVVSDATGAQVLRRTYRPYGEQQSEDGSHVESRGYIDQRTDAASGLTYLHHRYYDAAIGVFVSPDPLHPAGRGVGPNRYGYGFGSPINGTDPSGLWWCSTDPPVWCEYVEVTPNPPKGIGVYVGNPDLEASIPGYHTLGTDYGAGQRADAEADAERRRQEACEQHPAACGDGPRPSLPKDLDGGGDDGGDGGDGSDTGDNDPEGTATGDPAVAAAVAAGAAMEVTWDITAKAKVTALVLWASEEMLDRFAGHAPCGVPRAAAHTAAAGLMGASGVGASVWAAAGGVATFGSVPATTVGGVALGVANIALWSTVAVDAFTSGFMHYDRAVENLRHAQEGTCG